MNNFTITLLILFLFHIIGINAQELTVKSFRENMHDLSASTDARTDNNDIPCALIKVQMVTKGTQFEPNVVGNVQYKVNEYWVYMPAGTRHLKVKHPNFLTKDIVFADYGINALERKTTYELVITLPQNRQTEQVITEQYLVFQLKPENAMVEVNGEMWDVERGQSMKYLPFGTYEWKVTAKNYHSKSGTVTIDDPDNKHLLNIELQPAFGWIEVKSNNVNDAAVYIDNELVGKTPFMSDAIASGKHRITIKHPMYKAMTQDVTVNDGETTLVNPSLIADFCNVTLKVENNAEIWVNGEKKGESFWTGPLAAGNYYFETRKKGYREAKHTASLVASSQQMTINLPSPTPVYGSLNISTTPAMSQILIDGIVVGETPMMIRQILIGLHDVTVRREGYADFTTTINVQEGQTTLVEGKLNTNDYENQITNNVITGKIYDVVEQMPSFPGGQAALMQYLAKSIKYPQEAEKNGIEGRVIVTFVVGETGAIGNVQVTKSVAPSLDREAIRVVSSMPAWIPGKQSGHSVNTKYTVPVTFRLQ